MTIRSVLVAAMLLAVLALTAVGCGGDDETSASETAEATSAITQDAGRGEEEGDGDSEQEREREEAEAEAAGGKECDQLAEDVDGDPEREPPSDVEVPSDAHVYKSEGPFGKTMRYYAALDGTPEDLPSRRDDAQNTLVQHQGYRSLSTDEEGGAEAEAHLKGDEHTVDIQVAPLCEGKLRIRYTVQ